MNKVVTIYGPNRSSSEPCRGRGPRLSRDTQHSTSDPAPELGSILECDALRAHRTVRTGQVRILIPLTPPSCPLPYHHDACQIIPELEGFSFFFKPMQPFHIENHLCPE